MESRRNHKQPSWGREEQPAIPNWGKLNSPRLQSAQARTMERRESVEKIRTVPESTRASGLALQFPFLSCALPSETGVLKKTRPSLPQEGILGLRQLGTSELFKILGLFCSGQHSVAGKQANGGGEN